MNTLANSAGGVAGAVFGVLGYAVLVAAYWVPTIVAWRRHVPGKAQIVVVNLFLGWTFIGWVVALVMALRAAPPAPAPGQVLRPPNGV